MYWLICLVAIEVSVKSASSSQVTTKRVTLNLDGDIPAMESVEDMSATERKTVIKITMNNFINLQSFYSLLCIHSYLTILYLKMLLR